MLDAKWVRANPDAVRDAAVRKKLDVGAVDAFLERDAEYRELLTRVESMRAELKEASKKLGRMSPEERQSALGDQKAKKAQLQELDGRAKELRDEVHKYEMLLPQPPAPDVPTGRDDADNVEISRNREPPEFGFEIQSHDDLGQRLGIIDIPRGVKLGGSRNYLLLGDGAKLERAVLQFALEHMMARGFELVSVPGLVKYACMEGTGYFPGGEEQAYLVERDELSLVGTAEVPLTSVHSGEVLEEADLPIRRVALSPCYRREAGTYGKDTKGLYRVHQFWKVEQVVIGPADEEWSIAEHQRMLGHSADVMEALDLPFRVVNVCTGDLGQGQVQKFDIETWMPSRKNWGETHSASRFYDFQARRLNLRYRPKGGGKPKFCHTLNNTVVACPRVLIALLENHQREDGTVHVPEVLRPWMGKDTIGGE